MTDHPTSRSTPPKLTVTAFEQLLDIYGADRTRWPISERADAVALLATAPLARRLLAEAAAFDETLSRGMAASGQSDAVQQAALSERIMAASTGLPRLASVTPVVRAYVEPAKRDVVHSRVSNELWRGAAMLAASLMIGVFIGQSQLGAHALPALEALSGVSLPGSADRLAMVDLHLDANDVD
jgi:hypothetical protein